MASWSRRYVDGPVQVFKRKIKGKPMERVPRELYKHLDGMPDSAVEAWVRDYELRYEKRRFTPDHMLIGSLRTTIEGWLRHLEAEGLDPNTVAYHRLALVDYAVPYFLEREHPLQDVAAWPGVSVDLRDHLTQGEVKPTMIRRVNQSLNMFWEYLSEKHLVHAPLKLRYPPKRTADDETPLQYTQTPSEIMEGVAQLEDVRMRLWALCGYFFSLRTNEVYGLQRGDFRPGSACAALEACQTMAGAGLYSRLAVLIDRQKTTKGVVKRRLKTALSRAWVACFDERAAREIIRILVLLGDEEWFPKPLRYYSDRWRAEWPKPDGKEFAFKDLRRASLYWLGHHTSLTSTHVQKHARHKNQTQTMAYLRRPGEVVPVPQNWDLDA